MRDELKTLKDLANSELWAGKRDEFVIQLKALAIKWLKEDKENLGDLWDLDEWIKHFFNLTEEDLKMKEEKLEFIYQEMNPFKIKMPKGSSSKEIQELILENWEKEI